MEQHDKRRTSELELRDTLLAAQLRVFSEMGEDDLMLGSWCMQLGFTMRYFSEYVRFVDVLPVSMDACHNGILSHLEAVGHEPTV